MRQRKPVFIALAAGLICLLVYLRALSCDFVNFDDHDFVLNNQAIRNLDLNLLSWAFTTVAPISGSWIPLSWLSFALDYHFWGLDPFGFHLTNILLHAANTFLVVLIADCICRNRATEFGFSGPHDFFYPLMLLLAGLLFGIHPLRVEGVAWVTERRGVLNGLFYLLSLLFYLRHAEAGDLPRSARIFSGHYLLAILFMLLSFMAKPVSVVLPAIMLVLDWYPLGRFNRQTASRLLVEKIPFFLFSGVMTIVTIYAGRADGGLQSGAAGLQFWQKMVLSGNALFEYCRLTLYPVGILPLKIMVDPIPGFYLVKGIIIVAACVGVAIAWRRRWIPAVWLCFLIPILPVLPFFQMNNVEYAARYTYLPSVAPGIAGAVIITGLCHRFWGASGTGRRYLLPVLTVGLLVFYAGMTQKLIGTWKDSGKMWSRVIEFQPFDRAYFLRGLYYVDSGNYQAAVDDFTTCLTIAGAEKLPWVYSMNILGFRGEAYLRWGRNEAAVQDFTAAIAILPHPLYYYFRGMALKGMGRTAESEDDLGKAGRAKGQMSWVNP